MVVPSAASSGRLRRPDGHELAYDLLPAKAGSPAPGVVFLHGLASDRRGTKAEALMKHCQDRGYGFLAFDMFGHGEATGRLEEAGPGRWRDDALAAIDALTKGPQIVIGSSMGGWIMLLAALARPQRLAGLIGIAAAPDFTEDLVWAQFSPDQQNELLTKGVVTVPSDYGEPPMPYSRHLLEDGRAHLLLRAPMSIACPVRLLHGQQDVSVPWQTSLKIAEKIVSPDVVTIFVKDGDHRLSRPQDIALLCQTLDNLMPAS
jgi:pimeloyl-ACP methyl ester carboxylesterase